MAKNSDEDFHKNAGAAEFPAKTGDEPLQGDGPAPGSTMAPPRPEVLREVAALRAHVRESFGQAVMAMMMLPRYRNQSLDDLHHLVLEPLLRDRIAIAYPGDAEGPGSDMIGLAIWASVSEEADARIRDQIRSGVFPLRLKSEDWNSGSVNWLLDVIAPDQKMTARVIANFKQVVKEGSLRLHPQIARLVDEDTLKKMGAERFSAAGPAAAAPSAGTAD